MSFGKKFLICPILPPVSDLTLFYGTIQHDQGEKHRQRIFSPSTPPAKVEQLIEWPRREKMKTQGKK